MLFTLYSTINGDPADIVWFEVHNADIDTPDPVTVGKGIFNVTLGDESARGTPLTSPILNGPRWLGVQVGTDQEMRPLQQLTSVAYSIRAGVAESAESVVADAVTSYEIVDSSVKSVDIEDFTITTGPNELNTIVGLIAGHNTSGAENSFMGYMAGNLNTGDLNTFIGSSTGSANTTGSNNTSVGSYAGQRSETGNDNTFIGYAAGAGNIDGSANTYIGFKASGGNDGDGNVFLGHSAGANETNASNKLYIGNYSGNPDQPENTLIYGEFDNKRVGIGTTSPSGTLHVFGGIASDEEHGSDIILEAQDAGDTQGPLGFNGGNIILTPGDGAGPLGSPGGVGIGTTSPTGTLHVFGGNAPQGAGSDITLHAQNADLSTADSFNGGSIILTPGQGVGGGSPGNVVIDANVPGSYLDVAGDTRATVFRDRDDQDMFADLSSADGSIYAQGGLRLGEATDRTIINGGPIKQIIIRHFVSDMVCMEIFEIPKWRLERDCSDINKFRLVSISTDDGHFWVRTGDAYSEGTSTEIGEEWYKTAANGLHFEIWFGASPYGDFAHIQLSRYRFRDIWEGYIITTYPD
jgi:hypothetical protein